MKLFGKKSIKFTACLLLSTLGLQLISPVASYALTSGPTQPEVMSFEPVGTTDMVDMFTGDFVYNIPLLDVDGYPVNISYHGGVDMEQEASWVGLGWNINPGVISRGIRGVPDDMNGETIQKELNIKEEINQRYALGVGAELFGMSKPMINLSAELNVGLNHSNYKGYSVDVNLSAGVNVLGIATPGINLGVSSENGASVDYSLSFSFRSSQIASSDVGVGIGFSLGGGYNSRTAVKDKYRAITGAVTYGGRKVLGGSLTRTIPIGLNNIVPVITNRSTMKMYKGQLKLGVELYGGYAHMGILAMYSKLNYDKNGDAKGFGYLYADQANDTSIHDFTRDKDGSFNELMSHLPLGNMTYDVYSIAGQGTSGSFRPFRNDFGTVFDPVVQSNSNSLDVNVEVGIGNLFEIGGDITTSDTKMESGPWAAYKRPFTQPIKGTIYEPVFFKTAGELTATNQWMTSIDPINGAATNSLPKYNVANTKKRNPRGNLMTYFTATEAAVPGVASSTHLHNYTSNDGFAAGLSTASTPIGRMDNGRKAHHISEIVQTQTDGRKYVFGLPALNTKQEEYTFAVQASGRVDGLVQFSPGVDNTSSNTQGTDNFFSKTTTPAFAHSYLLTAVLSTDYVDITGNGVSDDDFGSFTKFNYSLKNRAYKWKIPYGDNLASYSKGFRSETDDDKGSYTAGEREQWILHSIESKNLVAEFYTSARQDALGVNTANDLSYKLDSISLYNKNDRLQNGASAVPVKTVIFKYNYELCPGVPNSLASGKLTLKNIFVKYGHSDKSLISPYEFVYNPACNYAYNAANKNRWGGYKPNITAVPNMDYPYVNQSDTNNTSYAAAWALSSISLPSGGAINISYEADDYAYVQDKQAMDMFQIEGVGNSVNFGNGANLYVNAQSPNLYLYFKRRKDKENPHIPFRDNYLGKDTLLHYNVDIAISKASNYEAVRGYAAIAGIGYCNNDPNAEYGYVKLSSQALVEGPSNAGLNPITYNAINYARYYLGKQIYSNSNTALGQLAYAFKELISILKNPVQRLVSEKKARDLKLVSSFMRLRNVGLKKAGGGHRVKKIEFLDNWQQLTDNPNHNQTYGKVYDYTLMENGVAISSGVASYEPIYGGDDNPLKKPIPYNVQKGSSFPPNDPIGLYQEEPIGESLYPSPVVGYRKVTSQSIHQDVAASAQAIDINEFYTAKDYPLEVKAIALDILEEEKTYKFLKQRRTFKVSQGYSLLFNDMHGKPKKTEKRIRKPASGESELVSYQLYNYYKPGSALPVIEYETGKFKKVSKVLGQDIDLTIDSRSKYEETNSSTKFLNLNAFLAGIIPIPIPTIPFWFTNHYVNDFKSIVATKVVQQYGILSSVESYNEGALTVLKNEAFDPMTGQAVVTSVNNEFNDLEYDVQVPAYWKHVSMKPSYQNINYADTFHKAFTIDAQAYLPVDTTILNYTLGDELLMTYEFGGEKHTIIAWVMDFKQPNSIGKLDTTCCQPSPVTYWDWDTTVNLSANSVLTAVIQPRYKSTVDWPSDDTITNISIKNIRSGYKNQLTDMIASYKVLEDPFDNTQHLKTTFEKCLNIKVIDYGSQHTAILPPFDQAVNPATYDELNPYLNGTRQINRAIKDYTYIHNREKQNNLRTAGIFATTLPFQYSSLKPLTYDIDTILGCFYLSPPYGFVKVHLLGTVYNALTNTSLLSAAVQLDILNNPKWVVSNNVSKWSPWGHSVEEVNAIGMPSTAVYGFNNSLPVGIAQNARQHEVVFESFEDYAMLIPANDYVYRHPSIFASSLAKSATANAKYLQYQLSNTNLAITKTAAHTGSYSLEVKNKTTYAIPISTPVNAVGQPIYNDVFLMQGKKYLVSYWYQPKTIVTNTTSYTPVSGFTNKSPIINGWQLAEGVVSIPNTGFSINLNLPGNAYVDDLRIMPFNANGKAFVYNVWNSKLIANLDENNYATYFEYDPEGNLVRTKKETEQGIMTINESRNANTKK